MTRASVSGSAPVGKYVFEVAAYGGSLAQFASTSSKADRAEARKNAAALRAALTAAKEPRERATTLEAVEKLEDTADAVADRVEHANGLFKAVTEDRLFDRDLVTGEIGALLGLLERLDRERRYDEEIRVAKALHGLCVLTFRWLDLVRSLRSALDAARAVGDESGQAWALNELGALHLCAGDPKKAEKYLERALEFQEGLGDAANRCATRHNLDSARRDSARPIQIRGPRRLILLGAVGALLFFGGGGAALGLIVSGGDGSGGGGDDSQAVSTVTLTVETRGADGSVSGRGIDCGADCTERLADGTTMTLTAAAGDRSDFVRWDGVRCDEGRHDEACTLHIDSDLTAIAIFKKRSLTTRTLKVEIRGTGRGSVLGDRIACSADCERKFARGSLVTLTARAASDSTFAGWNRGGCRGLQSCTVVLQQDATVVATFVPASGPTTAPLTVALTGAGSGSVSSAPSSILCEPRCRASFPVGHSVALTATPAEGSTFTGWSGGGCTGIGACVVAMTGPTRVFADFAVLPKLTVEIIEDGGSGTVSSDLGGISCEPSCTASLDRGETVTLTVSPDSSSDFGGWGGDCSGSAFSCTVTMEADRSVTARFVVESVE
jgi:tetratricopeptide (TPR) repeat protein